MASRSFTNRSNEQNRYNATDFFVVAIGATVFSVGFFGLNEGPERLWIAGMFAALALAFYAASLVCWVQYQRAYRLVLNLRMPVPPLDAVRGNGRSEG